MTPRTQAPAKAKATLRKTPVRARRIPRPGQSRVTFAAARRDLMPPDLRLDQVSFVTVHNAYLRPGAKTNEPLDARTFDHYLEAVYTSQVRGIELDFAEDERSWSWSVGHADAWQPAIEHQLGVYLRAIWAWSLKHEPHDPIVVYLEPKSELKPGFEQAFDRYLLDNFDPARIFRPSDLRGDAGSLQQAASEGRWPTITQLAGRFLFVVSGDGPAARAVASRPDSVCFADRGLDATPGRIADTNDPGRIVLNVPAPEAPVGIPAGGGAIGISETRWVEILDEVATIPGQLVRVYWCDQRNHVEQALAHGAWMIATNLPDAVMTYVGQQAYRPRRAGSPGARLLALTHGSARDVAPTARAARAAAPARAARSQRKSGTPRGTRTRGRTRRPKVG